MSTNLQTVTDGNVTYQVDNEGQLYNTDGTKVDMSDPKVKSWWGNFLATDTGQTLVKANQAVLKTTAKLGLNAAEYVVPGALNFFGGQTAVDEYNKAKANVQKGQQEIREQFQQQGGITIDEMGRIIYKNLDNPLPTSQTTGGTNPTGATTTPQTQPERGDLITLYENGQIVKSLTKAEIDSICAFAKQSFDAEDGYILRVNGENGDPSTLYYEPDGVVGSGYKRRGSTQPVNLKPATLILSERQYQAAIQEIYRRQKQLNMKDPAFENAVGQYPFMQQQVQQERISQCQEIVPHTPHTGALRVNYLIPGTNNYSMVVLSAEQVKAVRDFIGCRRDTAHQGYKLHVTGNDYQTPVSELYYIPNEQGTAYLRRGDASTVGVPISESTFKLNETQLQAAIMGIMQADAERSYQDPDLKKWYDLYIIPQPATNQGQSRNPQGMLQGQTRQTGQLEGGIPQGPRQGSGTLQGNTQGQITGTAGLLNGMTQKEEDSRNFFLSIGNFIDNSVFGPLADMVPISFLSTALRMLGNCISGLFKTIGYVMEGEWSKAGTQLFGWVKDAAIVGGAIYGITILKDKLKDIFPSSDEKTSSSSNSSSSLEDIIAGALGGATNSGSSGSTNSGSVNTTPAPTVNQDVYVELNHSSAGQEMGKVQTFTNANGTTERLLNTSDRFLPAAEMQNGEGTLWRVQVDTKTKNK